MSVRNIILILLCLALAGCGVADFIKCGDRGVCDEKWGGFVSICCGDKELRK